LQINIIFRFKPPNLRLIPSSINGNIPYCILLLCDGQVFLAIGMTILNKATHCSQVWTHMIKSSKLTTWAKSLWMDASSYDSHPKCRKQGACLLDWYPMTNHGNCMSQSHVCPFYNSYFHKLFFTICIMFSTKPLTLRWSQKKSIINQSLFTQLLKFSLEFHALIQKHF
jgi:hypothetical protein